MARPRLVVVCSLVAMLMAWQLLGASGQGATPVVTGSPAASPATPPAGSPVASPEGSPVALGRRLDLAAMALNGNDLPSAYHLSGESYTSADTAAAQIGGGAISPAEFKATGLRWFYESDYETSDGSSRIRTYFEEYGSPEGATAGFKLLENEARLIPGSKLKDLPGPGVGEQPAETTVGTIIPSNGGQPYQINDATFRVGRLLCGVEMDAAGSTPPDDKLVKQLAAKLERRVQSVLAGKAPAAIDFKLPGTLLPLDLNLESLQEGYELPAESLGLDPASAEAKPYRSGYERVVGVNYRRTPNSPQPYVVIGVSTYASAAGALAVLNQVDNLALPAGGSRQRLPSPRIPDADAAAAYHGSFSGSGPDDSSWVVLVVGERLAVISVLGSPEAQAAALDLATQQAACLAVAGPCAAVTLPASLTKPPSGTPVASPVASPVATPGA